MSEQSSAGPQAVRVTPDSPMSEGSALGSSYRLVRKVGKGAMGQVWQVTNGEGGAFAAKILRTELSEDRDIVDRFLRERSVLLGLDHPHIVRVQDLVAEGARLAIIMDYQSGGSVRGFLDADGPLAPGVALELMANVYDALRYAHQSGVLHKDVKPDNILLGTLATSADPDEVRSPNAGRSAPPFSPTSGAPAKPTVSTVAAAVRLSDFGIASLLQEGRTNTTGLLGTPQYMAPETISRGASGFPADVYSAGITLYELLGARTPYAGSGTDFTVAYRHVSARLPELVGLPGPIWDYLQLLLHKDPALRPDAPSAAHQLRVLATHFQDVPALPRAQEPEEFAPEERTHTVLRSGFSPDSHSYNSQNPNAQNTSFGSAVNNDGAPDLGSTDGATILKPRADKTPFVDVSTLEQHAKAGQGDGAAQAEKPWWIRYKTQTIVAGVLVGTVVLGAIAWFWLSHAKPTSSSKSVASEASAHLNSAALPTGLSTNYDAEYSASDHQIRLTMTYTAQKAPLSGQFLAVVPNPDEGKECPGLDFQGANAKRNQISVTGIDVKCGWTLSDITVPAGQNTHVSVTVPAKDFTQESLDEWLHKVDQQTTQAIQDPNAHTSAYPAQRMRSVEVHTPTRVVSDTPVKVTLLPVWPSGTDALNPLYESPSSGQPSTMLDAIAGGDQGVQFADGCAGALAVDSAGQSVTALQIAPKCVVRAQVGNFTDLQSQPFSITSRESAQ